MSSIPLVLDLNKVTIGQGGTEVFRDLDFSMADAEMCYLIGKSGSGKSTLLKTLYGALPMMSGNGQIAGFDLTKIDRKSIPMMRRKIGMVFQQFHLFEKWTVEQNLDYALKAIEWKDANLRRQRVDEVLTQTGLMDKKDSPVFRLSGGEQQKVVIGRAILNKPEIIIADEPTGNLDPESSEEIMKMLYSVASENKTAILIATHDYMLIEKFPARVFECLDGGIVEK
jgi:cell division transport system ATP-binding protein